MLWDMGNRYLSCQESYQSETALWRQKIEAIFKLDLKGRYLGNTLLTF